ncbi:carbohydrate ABC transporter permease [Micromonospora sp. NBC_00898]|uniref:carbohydrate ABC transporter permease n=1 Tax=Micromonospora sp. NBC_00898 TaxID=2975981 RepID=UPI00386B382C|nr:carbohydrate ABC transporter permease [Micromonospora sp. NBC_00898]
MDRDRIETVSLRWLRRLVIAAFLLVTVLPFWYMLVLSVRPIERLLLDPGALWVPVSEFTVATYAEVLKAAEDGGQGFLTFIRNSGLVAVAATLLTLVVAIPGAYAVSRLRFFGRRQVNALFLAVYLFPSIVIAIPLFVVFTRVGLRGSLFGLVLVYISQTLPVSVYMLKNYFETIPISLEESAAIDGAGRLGIIRRVSLPLAAPSIMAVALYDFMIAWNEFLFALLFLVDKPNRWTVSLGLSLLSDGVEVPKTVLMAGSVILTLPIVILFFASERLLTEGLTSGAEKG